MKEKEFKDYLKDIILQKKETIASRISNLKRIEKAYGDLDEHYDKDTFKYLLHEFTIEKGEDKKHQILILPVTNLVYHLYNEYFINLYQIAIVMYYDKFGNENIEAYSKWFEHFLGAFRMNRASIVEQSPIVLLRDYGNILQVIEQAYLVQEVLSTLKSFVPERYYEGFAYKEDMNGYVSIHLSDANQTKLSPARQNYYQKIPIFISSILEQKYWWAWSSCDL
ncbi:hypothetical protein G6R40_01675 [Chryseobacterium sp. POL2]|uniref:DUF7834 domain-containing protein n=1 Tax=Chryseobacterium sp. POL2 TaxID=2713414 RepID=UPI0013E157DC|nr:hypothetical protein [Chryseobacterium sp. POL2]QIG88444.1 hypothetical protein G6R40_01675 [Chryseobacterium sp. POL2]